MKMNELRLTNMIENHFYLDFNWKDKAAHLSVSWQTETVIGLDAAYLLAPVSNAWTVGLRVTL